MLKKNALCSPPNIIALAITLLWVIILMSANGLRTGLFWQDYIAIKALAMQMFDAGTISTNAWHPFLIPPLLFHLASCISVQGVDYLMAQAIIWLAYFLFLAKPAARRLNNFQLSLFLLFSFIFICLPGVSWLPLDEATIFSFASFYNRYLDVMWGGVFLLFFGEKRTDEKSDYLLIIFILLVPWFSKLSYFAGYSAVFLLKAIYERNNKFVFLIAGVLAIGASYEFHDHLVMRNLELLAARVDEVRVKTILDFRIISIWMLVPAFVISNRSTRIGWLGLDTFGVILISFLIAIIDLGNRLYTGLAPYIFLALFYIFRNIDRIWSAMKTERHPRTFFHALFILSIGALFFLGTLPLTVNSIKAGAAFIYDQLNQETLIQTREIPGLFVNNAVNNELINNQHNSASVEAKNSGEVIEYSRLINYLSQNRDKIYFIDLFPSLFPLLAAKSTVIQDYRAYISNVEFLDGGVQYRKQKANQADFIIRTDCKELPQDATRIDNTCFIVIPRSAVIN